MTNKFIIVEKSAGTVAITLNRPEKRNALNGQLVTEFLQVLKKLSTEEVRVLLIQGEGGNFCAGVDLAWMQEITAGSEKDNYADAQMLADLLYQLYHFPKPIIALAHGATMGGGVGILSACDIVIATKQASFAFSEVKIGLTPSVISPYVINAIGPRMPQYYFLTGERFTADTAYRIGLVHHVVDEDALLSTGTAVAKGLLTNGPEALVAAKALIRTISGEKITPALTEATAKHLAKIRISAEAQEGLQAFIAKRDPKWRQ